MPSSAAIVGKLYDLAAMRIAAVIATEVPDVDVSLIARSGPNALERRVRDIVNAVLQQLDTMRDELLAERLSLY